MSEEEFIIHLRGDQLKFWQMKAIFHNQSLPEELQHFAEDEADRHFSELDCILS